MQFFIFVLSWNLIDILNYSICHIFKFRQYKNVNIANFVYYGKTRLYSLWFVGSWFKTWQAYYFKQQFSKQDF